MKLRPVHFIWVFCTFAAIGILLAKPPQNPQIAPAAANAPGIKSQFTLTDFDGKAVTEASWPGKYLIVYFGFTHCPDVCPLGLNKITEALKSLNAQQLDKVQPLFITVDPERDNAAALKAYVPLFHQKIIGLTGSTAQIEAVKKAFRVYAEKSGDGPDYMVNHSAFTYLMSPDGSLHDVFSHDLTAEELAKGFKAVLN